LYDLKPACFGGFYSPENAAATGYNRGAVYAIFQRLIRRAERS